MDPAAEIPQGQEVDLVAGQPCVDVDARRLRRSVLLAGPVSKVLDNDNLLIEILVRLPPKPSSLPRASAVCKRWDSILSDPDFLKLFRKHHRKPPLLGFFNGFANRFVPIMDSPDRIHAACFSQPKRSTPYKDYGEYMGCRHGLALLINKHERNTIVWDPLNGKQRTVPFPQGLGDAFMGGVCDWHGAVLCVDAEDGHVHGDCFSSPFKLVLVCFESSHVHAYCSLYDSASGVWGNIFSTPIMAEICRSRPSILVGNAFCWLVSQGKVLVFDFEIQSFHVIGEQAVFYATDEYFQLLRMEDGGLGLAVLSDRVIRIWKRKSNCDGIAGWVFLLQKSIPLVDAMFSERMDPTVVGYDEDTNVIVLATMVGNFTLQLDSMQHKHIVKRESICSDTFYPYTNFFTAGNSSLSTSQAKNSNWLVSLGFSAVAFGT